MKTSDKVCVLPWIHLNIESDGSVLPCCFASGHGKDGIVGNLNTDSIKSVWNGDKMKTIRTEMMNGIEPKTCSKCFDKELTTGTSSRLIHNNYFSDSLSRIDEITASDGHVSEMKFKFWDFRFSNLCNFKCRTCGPRYSSAWVPDAAQLNLNAAQEKVWHLKQIDKQPSVKFLTEQIDNAERIYFAGGEPLMMEEHWRILELLTERKKFSMALSYNTNASVIHYNKKNVLDYWSQWNKNKIFVMASIDEIGERAELIRSGTVWSRVEQNLISMSLLDTIIVKPSITVSAMNVIRLPEIVEHLASIGVIKSNNFNVNVVFVPEHYHVSILPEDVRQQAIEKIQTFIAKFSRQHDVDVAPIFKYILHELKSPTNIAAREQFISLTAKLDSLRNEDTYSVIPELKCILS